ncbi:MAG: PspC domain-containing protein [Anaerolineales bacterium]|nr:PspC domain-containing protein [Anaerolineales bacterium]
MSTYKQLYRSRNNRMIGGVCSGLGDFFGIDPTVVRLVFVFGVLFGFGSFALIYLVMLFVVPEEPGVTPPPAPPASES